MASNQSNSSGFSPDSLTLNDSEKFSPDSLMTLEDSLENISESESSPPENTKERNSEHLDAVEFLAAEVFPVLIPCFEEMLSATRDSGVLEMRETRFNGLDHLAELLWNRNPRHPERSESPTPIFDTPSARAWLEAHPRPRYPMTRAEAAVTLQAAVRGFLARSRPDVQELRDFWKTLAREKEEVKRQNSRTMYEKD